jgi:fructoselysine 6-kinase
LVTVGDNVADIYPSLGYLYPGGNALNVAVAAHRNGVATAYVGAIGTDEVGHVVETALEQEDVRTERLRIVEGQNAYSVIELDDGDRLFTDSGLGVSKICLDDADLEYISGFDCVHTGDCSRTEMQLNELAAVTRVSFDFSDRPREYCEPLLGKVWLACFSGTALGHEGVEDLARYVLQAGPQVVLVTEGPRGAMIATTAGKRVHVEASSTKPLDTLGAGDAVIGSVLAGVLKGEDLDTVMGAAMSFAAKVCTHHGAFEHGRALDSPGLAGNWPTSIGSGSHGHCHADEDSPASPTGAERL